MTDVTTPPRDRADRCPGVLRPWIADDGALVRLRLVGGRVPTASLRALVDVAERFGDGTVQLTRRANLQVRGVAHDDGRVPDAFVDAVRAAGLLPSTSHELVRNIMVSPLSGRRGGRADLRPVADALDAALRADPDLADLSARFLVVLDDGRGDLVDRTLDLGAVAVDADHAQVRVGRHWGDVEPLGELPEALVALAHRFRAARVAHHPRTEPAPSDPRVAPLRPPAPDPLPAPLDTDPWHVAELPDGGASLLHVHHARDLRTQVASLPLAAGPLVQDDGRRGEHVPVPDGVLVPDLARALLADAGHEVVVTPWRSLLLPDLENA